MASRCLGIGPHGVGGTDDQGLQRGGARGVGVGCLGDARLLGAELLGGTLLSAAASATWCSSFTRASVDRVSISAIASAMITSERRELQRDAGPAGSGGRADRRLGVADQAHDGSSARSAAQAFARRVCEA